MHILIAGEELKTPGYLMVLAALCNGFLGQAFMSFGMYLRRSYVYFGCLIILILWFEFRSKRYSNDAFQGTQRGAGFPKHDNGGRTQLYAREPVPRCRLMAYRA
jgi:hypothetical protein